MGWMLACQYQSAKQPSDISYDDVLINIKLRNRTEQNRKLIRINWILKYLIDELKLEMNERTMVVFFGDFFCCVVNLVNVTSVCRRSCRLILTLYVCHV